MGSGTTVIATALALGMARALAAGPAPPAKGAEAPAKGAEAPAKGPGAAGGPAAALPWTAPELDPAALEAALARARAKLEALPATPADGSPEAARRAARERRVELLERLIRAAQDAEAARERLEAIPARKAALETKLEAARAAGPPPPAPERPGRRDMEAAEAALKARQAEDQALRDRRAKAADRLREIPGLIDASRKASEALTTAARGLRAEVAAAAGEARAIARLRLENNGLAQRVEEAERAAVEAEARLLRAEAPILDLEGEVLAPALDAAQRRFEGVQAAYARLLAGREAEIARKAQEAKARAGADPIARFDAEREAEVEALRLRNERDGLQVKEIDQANAAARARLDARKANFDALKGFVERYGGTAAASARLRLAYGRVRLERERAERGEPGAGGEALGLSLPEIQEELPAVEDRRSHIDEDARAWTRELLARVPPARRPEAEAAVARARHALREALRQRAAVLRDLHAKGVEAQDIALRRRAAIDEESRYLTAKIFWIRDADPVGAKVARAVYDDGKRLAAWGPLVARWLVRDLPRRLGSAGLLLFLAALILLPWPAGLLRRRIRRRLEARAAGEGGDPPDRDAPVDRGLPTRGMRAAGTELLAILAAAIWPAYLGIAGLLAGIAPLPPEIGRFASAGLRQAALALLAWKGVVVLLRPGGAIPPALGVPAEVAAQLRRLARWAGLATLALAVPASALRAVGSGFSGIPRALLLAYEALLVIVAAAAVRPRAPIFRALVGPLRPTSYLRRNASILAGLFVAGLAWIVVMDGLGYRFGARQLLGRVLESLGTLAILGIAYAACVRVLEPLYERVRRLLVRQEDAAPSPEGDESGAPARRDDAGETPGVRRLVSPRKALRIVFGILALYLVATQWNVVGGLQGLLTSAGWPVERLADGTVIRLTPWDILMAILILLVTFAVLRGLPGIYEVFLYPRTNWDAGLRYAVLAMSRYALFTVGVLVALGALHLGLGKIQWVLAAASVGLGFGLQEIVANFVSGLILLVERPIRVGDIITVGDMSGVVERINIRATTITNWDRQTVILPNKEFIVGRLTNWTHSDLIVRATITVGAAYGTDPEKVRRILLEVARAHPCVLDDPAPRAFFKGFGDSSLDFILWVFVPRPADRYPTMHDINAAIHARFQEEGVEIPFPQMDLHLRASDGIRWDEGGIEIGGG